MNHVKGKHGIMYGDTFWDLENTYVHRLPSEFAHTHNVIGLIFFPFFLWISRRIELPLQRSKSLRPMNNKGLPLTCWHESAG
jgi:hypothetical protein